MGSFLRWSPYPQKLTRCVSRGVLAKIPPGKFADSKNITTETPAELHTICVVQRVFLDAVDQILGFGMNPSAFELTGCSSSR